MALEIGDWPRSTNSCVSGAAHARHTCSGCAPGIEVLVDLRCRDPLHGFAAVECLVPVDCAFKRGLQAPTRLPSQKDLCFCAVDLQKVRLIGDLRRILAPRGAVAPAGGDAVRDIGYRDAVAGLRPEIERQVAELVL